MNTDIYAIYRACRLCGVGAGYKMPIIQSVIEVDSDEIELKQKIKECVQIEVNLHDRMPPLICELCVDKLQDFYEFRKMCQETNKTTRLRLGLPLQTLRSTLQSEPASILGVTEPLNSDSDEAEPLSKQSMRKPRPMSAKPKKESDIKIKVEPTAVEAARAPSPERREARRRRARSPRRVTRQNRTEHTTLLHLQDTSISKPLPRARPGPTSVVKRDRERQKVTEKEKSDSEIEDNVLLKPLSKRPRDVSSDTLLPVKKVKLSSEPAKLERNTRPGPKSSKEVPKAGPPQKPPPKAGPKSKKFEAFLAQKSQKPEPSPVPASKSSQKSKSIPEIQEVKEPIPKSRKSEPVAVAKSKPEASKSKAKNEALPLPGPKSKKAENAAPTPKTKKRDSSVLASKREASPKPPEKLTDRASPPPQKVPSLVCNICRVKTKAAQGLSSHMKTHIPTFTNPRLACNACEVWFATWEAAGAHHARHAGGLPYTCGRCYDGFRTRDDYELHFTRDQCLPTYEIPDVKCEECWKLFPTYKLLEDHRCPGEGGRPGGKCPTCKRTFASLKSLTTHEIRCTPKRKVEPEEPGRARVMLPARVRVVRCDSLLSARGGSYDVRGLPRKFGLDFNCTYPYLSMCDVKPEPAAFDRMVAIKDEIKEEYLNRDETNVDVVHWDSDSESDGNLSSPNKSVDSLSIIALKTLYSPKCFGKVPRKKRKVKAEIGLNSILGIHFHEDIGSSIDNIIDNLAKESNVSDNYDSDSILDKGLDNKSDSTDSFHCLKNLTGNSKPKNETKVMDKLVDKPKSTDNDRICNNDNDSKDMNLNRIETSDQNEVDVQSALSMNEKPDTRQTNDSLEFTTDCQARLNEISTPELPDKFSDDSKTTKNNDLITADDDVDQINETSAKSPINGQIVSNDIVNDNESLPNEDKVENSNVQALGFMDVEQSESETNSKDESKCAGSSDVEMSETVEKPLVSNIDNKIDTNIDLRPPDTSQTTEYVNDKKVETQSHETDDRITENGDLCVTNGETNDKDAALCTATDNSNVEDVTSYVTNNKPNKDDTTRHSNTTKTCLESNPTETDFRFSKINETENENADPELVDSKESLITENELFDTENVPSVDKFNLNYLDDEDKLLMAELDAQIGESEPESNTVGEEVPQSNEIGENSDVTGENKGVVGEHSDVMAENSCLDGETDDFVKKYSPVGITNESFSEQNNDSLEALISNQNDLKSLDLDNVSDEEYNFDI